jgi:hypothetical protein
MTTEDIHRRTYLAGVAAAGIAGLAGCTGSSGSTETGTLATQVTDQPGDIADFDSCVITVVGMWLGPMAAEGDDEAADGAENETADDETDGAETTAEGAEDETDDGDSETADDEPEDEEGESEGGREYYEFDEPQEADLVQLQGEQTQLVDERELEVGEYEYIQLDTDGVEATLNDGSSAEVRVPGNAPLTFNESFEIRADTRTTFTADFTPVRRGRTGRYNLQPVPRGITVSYEEIEGEETDGGAENGTDDGGAENETDGGEE